MSTTEPTPLHSPLVERQIIRVLAESGQTDAAVPRQLATAHNIRPDDFADLAHRELVEEVLALSDSGAPTDFASLAARVRESKLLASRGKILLSLMLLSEDFTASENALPLYAETLRGLALRRRLVELGRRIASEAGETGCDIAQLLATGHAEFASLSKGQAKIRTGRDFLDDVLAECGGADVEPIMPTGVNSLDALIGGLQPTLTVIGSLPGRGKSALLATIIETLVGRGVKVGLFSLEDPGTWLPLRLLSHKSGINQHTIRFARKSPEQLKRISKAANAMWSPLANVLIDDRVGLSPADVADTARDMILNQGAKVIMLDHFGELNLGKVTERHDLAVDAGLALLRDISKQFKVPVVVACHLKRREGLQVDTPPKLTDFGNSSAFERKARVALGLSRSDAKDAPLVITVLKQTNGTAGRSISVEFVGAAALVIDTSEPEKHYTDTEPEDDE